MNDDILAERSHKKMHTLRNLTYGFCALTIIISTVLLYFVAPLLFADSSSFSTTDAYIQSRLPSLFMSVRTGAAMALLLLCLCCAFLLYLVHGWSNSEQERLKTVQKDDLTGAFLYKPFLDQAKRQLASAARDKKTVGLFVFEVGNILLVNQKVGRDFGDRLLQACGIVTESCLRDTDLFGRLSGLRFAILLPTSDAAGQLIVKARLLQMLQEVRHSSSIGELALNVRLFSGSVSLQEPLEPQLDQALEQLNAQPYFWDAQLISTPDPADVLKT